MTLPTDPPAQQAPRKLSMPEFVSLLAVLMATAAFSIDAMLPSLPDIARTLSPDDANRAQLVLTTFMLGMGLGTFFAGPISDAVGRKKTLAGGLLIYIAGSFAATWAQSLEMLLLARFIQGCGASAARIVPMALIRDMHAGPQMARITSFVMMFFILVPAIAPTLGGLIAHWFGWRGVFGAFMIFGLFGLTWMSLRQPETLPVDRRRPLIPSKLVSGAREVLGHRDVRLLTMVQALGFAQMFALLSVAQQLFASYGVTTTFPYWLGAGAIIAGVGSAFNARFVMRLGMHRIARGAYVMQICASALMAGLLLAGIAMPTQGFAFLFLWNISVFTIAGMTFGNLNAMAMQRMGHMAGMAASVMTSLSTVGAVVIAAPVGLLFNGTAWPNVLATLVCSTLAWMILGRISQGAEVRGGKDRG